MTRLGASLWTFLIAALLCCGWSPQARAVVPSTSAQARILIQSDTGTVISSARADERRAIASTTKLMTAYLALTRSSPQRRLTVQPYSPAPEETVAGLRPGERLSVSDLLTAMLLPSGGDAANTLAIDIGGSVSHFVELMNQAARTLGMRETHYSTPVGLDMPGNYSSASDLAHLAIRLLENQTFASIVRRSSARLSDGRVVVNRNHLIGAYPYVVGVKTGHTADAGYCLVGAARRDGVNMVSVVLGDPSEASRDSDTLALLRYGLSLYRAAEPISATKVYARVPVAARPGERLRLFAEHAVNLVVPRGIHLSVRLSAVPIVVEGPLPVHTKLGEVLLSKNGRIASRVPLINTSALAAPPLLPELP